MLEIIPSFVHFVRVKHYSDQCDIITEVASRRDILRKNRCCFNCLKPGHQKRNCRIKVKCFKCKAVGSHHTALCMKNEVGNGSEEASTNLVNGKTSVLLQTVTGFLTDVQGNKFCGVKILLDSCSQQTYIIERVASALNLKPLRQVNMVIKAFGNNNEKNMRLNEYRVCLRSINNDTSFYFKVLAVPTLCSPIGGQRIELAVDQHPFLKKLQLADNEKCDNKNVDLLIGADVYWQIVTGEIKKDDNSGLIAINSVLGWLISGPIKSENQSSSVNVTTSHVMKIECEERSDVILTESLQKFWDLDTIGISEGELSVYDEFMEDIEFINGKRTSNVG